MEYCIGFDMNRNRVRILCLDGETAYTEVPVSPELAIRGDYEHMLGEALQGRTEKGDSFRVVLPDSAVACDFFRIPTLKNGMKQAIRTEFETCYPQHSRFSYHSAVYRESRKYVTYEYVLISRSVLEGVTAGLQPFGGLLRGITTAAAGTAAAVSRLESGKNGKNPEKPSRSNRNPRRRASQGGANTVLFADVQPHTVRFTLTENGRPLCSQSLPFGAEALYQGNGERSLFRSPAAERHVYAAMEAARKQKAPASALLREDREEPLPAEDSGEERTDSFRVVLKRALLMVQELRENPAFDDPGCILVNLPEPLRMLPERWNEEGDNGIPVRAFTPEPMPDVRLMENLDLYGAGLWDKAGKLHQFQGV